MLSCLANVFVSPTFSRRNRHGMLRGNFDVWNSLSKPWTKGIIWWRNLYRLNFNPYWIVQKIDSNCEVIKGSKMWMLSLLQFSPKCSLNWGGQCPRLSAAPSSNLFLFRLLHYSAYSWTKPICSIFLNGGLSLRN